jgi:hypothetical protein
LHQIGRNIFEGSEISPVLPLAAFWLTDKVEQMEFDGWLTWWIESVMSRIRVWATIQIGEDLLFMKKKERFVDK